MEQHPSEAPWFYAAFGVMLVASGALVCSGVNLINLSLVTSVVNALLLPIVLVLLYRLARVELPEPLRLKGHYAKLVALVFVSTSALALYAGFAGMTG